MPDASVELSRLAPTFAGNPFVLLWQFGMPAAVAVVAFFNRRRRIQWLGAGREVLLLMGGLTLYKWARVLIEADAGPAFDNAHDIIALERGLRFYIEPHMQDVVLQSDLAVRFFNANYAYGFQPVMIAALTWLYATSSDGYRLLRNSLGISVLVALATFALFPLAPPRLVPEAGMVDTIARMGGHISFTNQYAAMPSLHVGWMVLAGYCVWRSSGSRRRWLAFVPGLVMGVTVVVTGNHYWLDGVVGAAYCVGAAVLLPRLRTSRGSRVATRPRRAS